MLSNLVRVVAVTAALAGAAFCGAAKIAAKVVPTTAKIAAPVTNASLRQVQEARRLQGPPIGGTVTVGYATRPLPTWLRAAPGLTAGQAATTVRSGVNGFARP